MNINKKATKIDIKINIITMNNIRITEVAIQKLKIITTTNNKLD